MIGVLLGVFGGLAWGCETVESVPESLQVAWISPINDTARPQEYIEVVRVRDLRTWIRTNSADPVTVLQANGMLTRKAADEALDQEYKITIFDVQREWLCRPVMDVAPGTDINDVPACQESEQRPANRHHRPGFTGCGYTLHTGASVRGLDVFRIPWQEASAWGFCVMPLDRFLEGA